MYLRDAVETWVEAGEPVKQLRYKHMIYYLQECKRYEDCIVHVYKRDNGDIIHVIYPYMEEEYKLYNKTKSTIFGGIKINEVYNNNTIIPLQEVGNRHLTKLRNKGLLK